MPGALIVIVFIGVFAAVNEFITCTRCHTPCTVSQAPLSPTCFIFLFFLLQIAFAAAVAFLVFCRVTVFKFWAEVPT